MKRIGVFSIGIAVAIAIHFWPRGRASEAQPVTARASSQVLIGRSGSSERQRPNVLIEAISRNPLDGTLALIRLKLIQLSETKKADKGTEDELTTDLLAVLTDDNAAEITRALSADELHSRFGLAALQHWLKVDGSTAADWVAARTDATDEQVWAVAHELAQDRTALELYCTLLPNNTWRQVFLKSAALEAMWRDPVEAIHLVERMNPDSAQLDLLQATVCTWMIGNPGAASGWITQVQDPMLREELVCAGAKTYGGIDPLSALEWLISAVPVASDGSERLMNETVQDIVGTWVETEPAQAASLVAQFPAGAIRAATVDLVSRRWQQRDPAAAGAWIKTLPEGNQILASYRTH